MINKKGLISGVKFAAGLVVAMMVVALFAFFIYRIGSGLEGEGKHDLALGNFEKLVDEVDKLLKGSATYSFDYYVLGAFQLPDKYIVIGFPKSKDSVLYFDPVKKQNWIEMRKPCRGTGCLCLYHEDKFDASRPNDYIVCHNFAVDFIVAGVGVNGSWGNHYYKDYKPPEPYEDLNNIFQLSQREKRAINYVYLAFFGKVSSISVSNLYEFSSPFMSNSFGIQNIYLEKMEVGNQTLFLIQPDGKWRKNLVEAQLENITFIQELNKDWSKIKYRPIYLEQFKKLSSGGTLESPVLINLREGNLYKLAYSEKAGYIGFYWVFGSVGGRDLATTFWLVDNKDEVVGEKKLLEMTEAEMEPLRLEAANCVGSGRTWDAEKRICEGEIPVKIVEAENLYAEAYALFENGAYDEAIAKFEKLRQEYPDSSEVSPALYNLGLSYLKRFEKKLDPNIGYSVTSIKENDEINKYPNLYADLLKTIEIWKTLAKDYPESNYFLTKANVESNKYLSCADPKEGKNACHQSWDSMFTRCWFDDGSRKSKWTPEWLHADVCVPCQQITDKMMSKEVCLDNPCTIVGWYETYWDESKDECAAKIPSTFPCSHFKTKEQCENDPCYSEFVKIKECCHWEYSTCMGEFE
ncbi:tetratricopeptide repeat protein [Nanoarchaeota archaeon]